MHSEIQIIHLENSQWQAKILTGGWANQSGKLPYDRLPIGKINTQASVVSLFTIFFTMVKGKRAAAFFWPGSEVKKGLWTCPFEFCKKYNGSVPFEEVQF